MIFIRSFKAIIFQWLILAINDLWNYTFMYLLLLKRKYTTQSVWSKSWTHHIIMDSIFLYHSSASGLIKICILRLAYSRQDLKAGVHPCSAIVENLYVLKLFCSSIYVTADIRGHRIIFVWSLKFICNKKRY